MTKSLFDFENNVGVDFTKQPLFFGKSVDVSRFDVQKYPFLEKQARKQLGFFWVPEEISLENDKYEFHNKVSEAGQHVFTANIQYQILLDSVQGRGPAEALLPACSNPELESFIELWGAFEGPIHARSYTHIIRNLYDNPSEVFNNIVATKEIQERAASVTKYYDDFIEYHKIYDVFGGYGMHTVNGVEYDVNEEEMHRKLFRVLVSIYILEGIRFYVSFACSWAFSECMNVLNKMAKIIKLICRDENLHMAVTNFILRKIMEGDEGSMFQEIALECMDEMIEMFESAVEQECQWADYLFQDGSIIGLNAKILKEFIMFICDKRLKGLGMSPIFKVNINPIPWTDHWINSKTVQTAPQETEIIDYVLGGIARSEKDQDTASSILTDLF